MAIIDMVGYRSGRLVVQKLVGRRSGQALWLCLCDCDNTHAVVGQNLRRGHTRSCGCFRRDVASRNGHKGAAARGFRISHRGAISAAKRLPCTDCRLRYPESVMEFDHVPGRGPKLFNLSRAFGRDMTEIAAEIRKCDLVCANCHRMRTYYRLVGA